MRQTGRKGPPIFSMLILKKSKNSSSGKGETHVQVIVSPQNNDNKVEKSKLRDLRLSVSYVSQAA